MKIRLLSLFILAQFSFLLPCYVNEYFSKNPHVIKEEIISPQLDTYDCHSSCIIEAAPGILCAVWKAGIGSGFSNIDMQNHVGIWMSRCIQGEWSSPQQIVDSPDSVCWSPVLTQFPSGEVGLFYRIGKDPRHTLSLLKRSADGGVTWSEAEILPAGIVGPTKAKPVYDKAGNMICGSSVEAGSPESSLKATACWIEIFSQDTSQWTKYGPLEIPGKRFGCIEPALFWTQNGTLKLVCRDRSFKTGSEGWIWTAESMDGGKTWNPLEKTTLPNPDSGIAVAPLDPNTILLFYNHSHTTRYPLSCAETQDGGNTWTPLFDIETESGEFPSALVDSEGTIHVTYAWQPPGKVQRTVKHIIIKK